MVEISVVVPVRNESENIKLFLQSTENTLNKLGKSFLYKFDILNEEVEILNLSN